MKISKDCVVSIDFTLKSAEGEILDTSDGDQPLLYLQGHEHLVPGLERRLEGLEPGEELQAVIPPEEGYGIRDEEDFQVVKKSAFPEDAEVKMGMNFHAQDDAGNLNMITVVKIEGEDITLDYNHPLAGKDLHFDISIREVRKATQEELDHGHVHTPGHDHH